MKSEKKQGIFEEKIESKFRALEKELVIRSASINSNVDYQINAITSITKDELVNLPLKYISYREFQSMTGFFSAKLQELSNKLAAQNNFLLDQKECLASISEAHNSEMQDITAVNVILLNILNYLLYDFLLSTNIETGETEETKQKMKKHLLEALYSSYLREKTKALKREKDKLNENEKQMKQEEPLQKMQEELKDDGKEEVAE